MPSRPETGTSQKRWETFYRKKCHHQEFLCRIGKHPTRANLRMCSLNPREPNPVSIQYTFKIGNALLPIPLGVNSNRPEAPTTVVSKGTGVTRQMARFLGPLSPPTVSAASVLVSLGEKLKTWASVTSKRHWNLSEILLQC